MNLWILNHYAIAPGGSGGTRHFDLSKELKKMGHEVTIFASSFDHQTRTEKQIPEPHLITKETFHEGVRFVWVKTTSYQRNDWRRVLNMINYTFRAYGIAKKQQQCPDVIIGSLMHPFAALLGYRLAKKFKCKFYFEERDLWPQTLVDLGKISEKSPVVWLLSKMERFLYKKADRIIVLFDKAVNYVTMQGVQRDKVHYIPNGVDLKRYRDDQTDIPFEYEEVFGKLQGKYLAIYTGAHGMANNLDLILDTARLLVTETPDIHFLFIGDGPEKNRLQKRKETEKLVNVNFLPPVSKERIPAILQNVHVGLLPLQNSPVFKWGISPNKLFDYMASRLPVILLCNLTGTPVDQSGGGRVIQSDFVVNLRDTLLEFAADRNSRVNMGQKARAFVEEHHSWEQLSKGLHRLLLEDVSKT